MEDGRGGWLVSLATIPELGDTGPPKVTIKTLPDVALLEIFDFYVDEYHWKTDA